MTQPAAPGKLRRRRPERSYRSTGVVDRNDAQHPGVRALVERLLRRRFNQRDISREVKKRFGVRISPSSISRFWKRDVQPAEEAETAAYRQARAQARALLQEMKADPTLDAAQIAELMLSNQIVQDRMKLAEADIMDLYKEQRERKKLELQSAALRLREKQAKTLLKKSTFWDEPRQIEPETLNKIREIYGLPPTFMSPETSANEGLQPQTSEG